MEFIKLNDAAIIPVTDNDFTSCKTNNRMVTAFSCGLDVIADPTPSYKEFEQYCFLGDWRRGIEEVIKSKKDKSGKKKRIDGARKIIKEAYSLDIIARKWLNLLNKVN